MICNITLKNVFLSDCLLKTEVATKNVTRWFVKPHCIPHRSPTCWSGGSFNIKSAWAFCSVIFDFLKNVMVQNLEIYNDCCEIYQTLSKIYIGRWTIDPLSACFFHFEIGGHVWTWISERLLRMSLDFQRCLYHIAHQIFYQIIL